MKKPIRLVRRLLVYLIVAALGFVVGVLGVVIAIARSGPDLEPWHTAHLTEEFTADRAGDVRSFDDYEQLEVRLFAQLDEQVYAHTETGAALMFARYSSGSESDPRGRTPDWNRSVELPADPPVGGVLLLHGMTDSPYSLRALGESLNERGYWVVGLRLPGHGTAPSGLTTARWEDMAAAVRLGTAHLASKVGGKPVHMMGYSNGAPLAVNHVLDVLDGDAETMPASLVLISPALGVRPAAALAKWKRRLALVPGLEQLAWTGILPEFDPYKYNSFPVNAGEQVFRLTRRVAKRIEARSAADPIESFPPTLVLLSTVDATVSVDAVIDNLLEHLAPGQHELVLFDINRRNIKTSLLVSDPGPLTARLMADGRLPFSLELITNENAESVELVSRRKAPVSAEASVEALGVAWPRGVISLSHVALPFPPDDPLYGRRDPDSTDLNLGELAIRGERGLLRLPSDWLLRLRFNPFYDILETRAIDWVEGAG